jgi:hypothetical protein
VTGATGRRKGQLRVLGSPSASARHTKEPRTGGATGGAGSPRTRFFFAKVPSYISEDTKTGLQTADPQGCQGQSDPIGTVLAAGGWWQWQLPAAPARKYAVLGGAAIGNCEILAPAV